MEDSTASLDIEQLQSLSIDEIQKRLGTSPETGLTDEEARTRLEQYGRNEIPEKEESMWHRVLRRFWGPIPWMIEVAAVLSAVVRKWEDFTIIVILLLVNAFVDLWQESKAISALEVLKEKLAHTATVLRDGKFREIDARELVPGDVIQLKIGDLVPADVILLKGDFLQVDQSALTGESLPVNRRVNEGVYGNSVIKQGEMLGVVVGTGLNTYFGRTVSLVARAEREQRSHFQQAVIRIGDYLIALTVVLAIMILLAGLFQHQPVLEIVRFVLVLTVASIPVALPAVLTVTMAVGAMSLARKQAIVSRLAAIEELAGVDVLCADKTGTLTQNSMTIEHLRATDPFTTQDLLLYAGLASREENQDPIELPIFAELHKLNLYDRLKSYYTVQFTPFDPVRKRTEAVVQENSNTWWVTKGAPQVILKLVDKPELEETVGRMVEDFASKGFRVLAVAVKKGENAPYEFVGLIPLYDPPRPDSKEVIEEARQMGLDMKMVTGDHVAIARFIAETLDIGKQILDIREVREEGFREWLTVAGVLARELYQQFQPSAPEGEAEHFARKVTNEIEKMFERERRGTLKRHESEIVELIERADGFAQVFPEDKYFIVDKLQRGGHIVGMTGDGVNDAPALKKADAGIAVSGATDAARAAASIVLLAPGLSVIIDGLREARLIFERMKSYAIYRIAETIRVILFMTAAILIFQFYPITAIMIIILALLNDLPILTIAYDNAKLSGRPVRWDMREVLTVSTTLGIAGVISSFLLFYLLQAVWHFPADLIQSLFFVKLVVAGHGTIYNTRTYDRFFWHRPYPSRILFGATFSTRVLGTLVGVYGWFLGPVMTPVGWTYAAAMWGYALVWFVFNDFIKVVTYRYLERRKLI